MQQFHLLYDNLRISWQESSLQFLFSRTILARFINQHLHPDPFAFFQAYFASWPATRLRFEHLILSRIQRQNFIRIAEILIKLKSQHLFNPANTYTIANHPHLEPLAKLVLIVHHEKLQLTQAQFTTLTTSAYLEEWAQTFAILSEYQLLNQENFSAIINQPRQNIHFAISDLRYRKLLNPWSLGLILAHNNPYGLSCALIHLSKSFCITHENLRLLKAHDSPSELATLIVRLENVNMSSLENKRLIAAHRNPYGLDCALQYLRQARILTPENLAILLHKDYQLLTQSRIITEIWERIPSHQLTQENYSRLVAACLSVDARGAMIAERNRILRMGTQAHLFNPQQSTHTTSVHRSVSASALRLWDQYAKRFHLNAQLLEFKRMIMALDARPKHEAAKRCLQRLMKASHPFRDSSGISLSELLALAYVGIQDESLCHSSVEDGISLLIEGLYEIQRGYNIHVDGSDDLQQDRPICQAGTFNKIIEKLHGIHDLVEVYYITPAAASAKFPILANQHACQFLQHISQASTAEEYFRAKTLYAELKEEGCLRPIWDKIKHQVQDELWQEFAQAYAHRTSDLRFIALIDNGIYLPSPDIAAFEETLMQSPGSQATTRTRSGFSVPVTNPPAEDSMVLTTTPRM